MPCLPAVTQIYILISMAIWGLVRHSVSNGGDVYRWERCQFI